MSEARLVEPVDRVELSGAIRRALSVLRRRDGGYDKSIREFHVDVDGMHIGEPFHGIEGILEGHPIHVAQGGRQ